MKKVWRNSLLRGPALRVACGLFATGLFTGCKALPPMPPMVQDLGPSYKPSNIYRASEVLPVGIRRVALLPLTLTRPASDLEAGVATLEPEVYSELEKTKRFEVIPVTREEMQQWSGAVGWRADQQLPPDMLKRVSELTGSDAVLFCQLTRYSPYQPLAAGWKFTLVDTRGAAGGDFKARILWSVDEVLDAGDPTVTTGARAYYNQHLRNDAASADPSSMLSSPARFGQYTLATLLATIPARGGEKH